MIYSAHARNPFDQSTSSIIDTRTTLPGGKLKSIHGDFPAVLVFIFMEISRIVCSVNMHDVAKFQRDLNILGIKNSLQSEPMKSKPSPLLAANCPPSD